MATKIDIVNLALNRLGENLIRSLDDGSKEASRMNLVFDPVYEQVLRNHNWKCATFRQKLVKITGQPTFGYKYAYQLPTDPKCMKPLVLGNPSYNFTINGQMLLTDLNDADLIYIGKPQDVTILDPLFVKVLYLSLAVELAYTMVESNTILNGLMQQLDMAWEDARFTDASEGISPLYDNDNWVASRQTSGDITISETNIQ